MSFRSALGHRGFRALWLGQLASRVGDSVHEIALIWVVYEVTGDPMLLSLTFVASFLPSIVLSLPAGALVDRMNRRSVLVGSDVVRGLVVLGIPLFGRGPLLVPMVLAVAFVTGVLEAFFKPARTAIVPALVPEADLDAANSLTQMTFSLSQVLFALGGVVVAAVGSFAAFYVDAGSFFLSAGLMLFIPNERGEPSGDATDGHPGGNDRSVLAQSVADVRDGIRFVADRRLLCDLVVLVTALNFALAPLNVAIPVFATDLPIAGELAVGVLYTALFSGVTLGSVLVSRYDGVVATRRGRVIVAGVLGFGLLIGAASQVPPQSAGGVVLVCLLFSLAGISSAAVRVPSTTLGHLLVPEETLGRYSAVVSTISSLGFVVGLGLAGPVIGAVGARLTLALSGAVALLVGVSFAFQPIFAAGDGGAGTPSD